MIAARFLLGLFIPFISLAAQAASPAWQRSGNQAVSALELHRAQARYAALTGQWEQLPLERDDPIIRINALLTAGLTAQAIALESALPKDLKSPVLKLSIADALYAEQRYEEAQNLLNGMTLQSDTLLTLARNERLTRIGIRLKNYDDAALPLADAQSRTQLQPIQRYNLGIAWLGAGAGGAGANELNWVGSRSPQEETRATVSLYLADRANLSLGYWLLSQEKYAPAAQVLRRVRIDSPVAAQAMLGLGWAEFHHDEANQPLTARSERDCHPVDPALWKENSPLHSTSRELCTQFERASAVDGLGGLTRYASAETGYRRAAVLWQDVTSGDARDPVVAEALANLPHALAKAGDVHAAQVAATQAAARLRQATAAIRSGQDRDSPHYQSLRQQRLTDETAFLRATIRGFQSAAVPANPIMEEVGRVLSSLRAGDGLEHPTPEQRGLLSYFVRAVRTGQMQGFLPSTRLTERREALSIRMKQLLAQAEELQETLRADSRQDRAALLERLEASVRVFLASLGK